MNKEQLLESLLFIAYYIYKAVFERLPVLNTVPMFAQYCPTFLDIRVELKIVEDEGLCSFSQLEWAEMAPISKINK